MIRLEVLHAEIVCGRVILEASARSGPEENVSRTKGVSNRSSVACVERVIDDAFYHSFQAVINFIFILITNPIILDKTLSKAGSFMLNAPSASFIDRFPERDQQLLRQSLAMVTLHKEGFRCLQLRCLLHVVLHMLHLETTTLENLLDLIPLRPPSPTVAAWLTRLRFAAILSVTL